MNYHKFRHFFFNKYVLSIFVRRKYHLSYDYKHKALWFRTYKVASRTINSALREGSNDGSYIYGSEMPYIRRSFRKYFKFAFVRNPEDRFLSAWRDKIFKRNHFNLDEETRNKMKNIENFVAWVETFDLKNCDEHLRVQSALIDMNNIDFIGRFEYFDRDFAILAEKLNLKVKTPERLNPTSKSDVNLTPDIRKRIYRLYRKDFEIFYPDHYSSIDSD